MQLGSFRIRYAELILKSSTYQVADKNSFKDGKRHRAG